MTKPRASRKVRPSPPPVPQKPRDRTAIAALACAGVFVIANWALVTGDGLPMWDADSQFAPWYTLVADHARAGRLLLWNPWSSAGSPDFAEPQVGAFSPVTVAFGLLTGGTLAGYTLYWLALWLFGGLGIVALGRHLRASAWGSFSVALGYLFSGFFTGHAQHTSHVYALAWLPWIIWRIDLALLERRWWPALQAGALWGLSALGGYPGLALLSGAYVLAWAGGRALTRAAPPGATLLRALAVVSLGLVVLAPTYGAFVVESRGFSDRSAELPREIAVGDNALHPGALSTLASPYLSMLWHFTNRQLWAYTDGSSNSVWVGAGVVWLALLALVLAPRDQWRWWLLAGGLLAVALALGRTLPLRGWLYDLFPPARYFRHAAIFRNYFIFSIAALALLGASSVAARLGEPKGALRRIGWATAPLVAAALSSYGLVLALAPSDGEDATSATAHAAVVWASVAALAATFVLPERAKRERYLVGGVIALAAVDAVWTYRLVSPIVYHEIAEVRSEWERIARERSGALDLGAPGRERVSAFASVTGLTNKNLPLKLPVLLSYTPFSNAFHKRWTEDRVLAATATGRDRIWFSDRVGLTSLTSGAFEAFVRRSQALESIPLVLHQESGPVASSGSVAAPPIDSLPAARRVAAQVVTYEPNVLELAVDAPLDGWLLVTDRWAPGWQATVNGRQVAVRCANFIFRAVPVAKGRNQVRFQYRPFGFPALLALSWGTLLLIGIGSVVPRVRRW